MHDYDERLLPTIVGLQQQQQPDCNVIQNKKLSCRRDHATLRVIEYFAKSLKVTQGHSK